MAQPKKITPAPLIDREIFFGNPEITGAQLSPDGKYLSFIKPYNGVRNIWIKKLSESFEKARPLTSNSRPISNYFWSRNSKFILFFQDKGGNENFQIYAVSPTDKANPSTGVPDGRDLTKSENSRADIVHLSKSNPDQVFIALNDRDASWHDLYDLRISTGDRKLIYRNTSRVVSWVFDQKDKLRLAVRNYPDGSNELLRIDNNSEEVIYRSTVLEDFTPLNFHTDGSNVYLLSNTGLKRNLTQLVLLNINTAAEKLIESDPKKNVDLDMAYFSEIDNSLLMTVYKDNVTRIYFKNKSFSKDYDLIRKQFKGLEVSFNNSTKDENLWLITVYSDTDPGAVYLFDRKSKKSTFLYRPRPKLPIEEMSPTQIISYKSEDGLVIPAYLTIPKGSTGKNLPLVVNPHGGPWARDNWGFNSLAQFLANRGYAVLQMNFRGSTGFGKKFIDAGNLQWGDRMQDDISSGVNYLVKKGIADPKHVGIYGGSYGGYATLAGLCFTPELYACGVSMVGPSSLLTLLESLPPYWEAGRKIFYTRMGDPTNADGYAQLRRQSPLYSVDRIIAPLMVVQGANDPRVKKAESDQIVIAMRDKNLPVEYLCANDEGHGFANPYNSLAFYAAMEQFLSKHLGGRYQTDMSNAIQEKLKAITVDIASLKKSIAPGTEIKINSISSHDLEEGSMVYRSSTKFLGEIVQGSETIEIKSKGDSWVISSSRELPIGLVKDGGKIHKEKLTNFTRDLEIANTLYQIGYTDNQITVRKTENGKKTSYKIKTSEACFADGPLAAQLISCLPLTDTFQRQVINIDLERAIPVKRRIEVKGIEPVNGTDCFKVIYRDENDLTPIIVAWVSISDKPKTLKYILTDQELSEEPVEFVLQN
ncbi:MAG: prolyl oligopeptidase family serine peptidase [Saprospiraceae bacterium]|nr:prolyl oligopeptidase family serine peptidase [Saprospiraceae bacterium]HMW38877.1 prolyl oligopeptidase family serine peptidase [Saprospiraceae bacterium]HMX86939.1 prolyl oligopeptidase family serine peptidase [Saprospiraceae bacterium]HMZ39881.1 prolyl oligopeptidase family serine peptidase [Saprospiraceae bacterium]HNB31216.1 prolyl oligopeptidase family serine peptidase [Saprospiraceae bacterium]